MPGQIKWGDLGSVAGHYVSRPSYAPNVIDMLGRYVRGQHDDPVVADIGAGTGKLTSMLAERGFSGYAVEPSLGMSSCRPVSGPSADRFQWRSGSAEETGLSDASIDWICMGTAFHWTDYPRALEEFHRILRPGGYFTAIWDLNDPNDDVLMKEIEAHIEEKAPGLTRVQHNIYRLFAGIEPLLTRSRAFDHCVAMVAPHVEVMSHGQYLDMWRSYHDVPSQIGGERWEAILDFISSRLDHGRPVHTHYRTHAWLVRSSPEGR